MLAIIISLPLPDPSDRASLLQFVGILLSAAIALASTTLLGNAMAGLMLRAVRNFKAGDFIQVEGHFGRITERRLVHTEIQTEDRDLTTIPNLFLVTHPVKVIRASGTVISANVSLGYEVPRAHVQELMLQAAAKAGLSKGFVQVKDRRRLLGHLSRRRHIDRGARDDFVPLELAKVPARTHCTRAASRSSRRPS